jgi:hypothetical protein
MIFTQGNTLYALILLVEFFLTPLIHIWLQLLQNNIYENYQIHFLHLNVLTCSWICSLKPTIVLFNTSFLTSSVSEEQKLIQTRALIESISTTNYQVLYYLIALVRKISTPPHVANSKMSFDNMAIVIGPNILRSRKKMDLSQMEAVSKVVNRVTSFIIENYSKLFKKNSPYDESLLGIEASEKAKVSKDEQVDIQELRAETVRLRLAHRQQQSDLLGKLHQVETEKRIQDEEILLLRNQNQQLAEEVKTKDTQVKDVEAELEKAIKGESDQEQFEKNRENRLQQDEFMQFDKLDKLLEEQDRQVKAMQESMHRLAKQ